VTIYRQYVFPALSRFDAERVHDATVTLLELAQANPIGQQVLRSFAGPVPSGPVRAMGLDFPNVIGVAAGFDKGAQAVPGLALLGFGHIEVGTVTPAPQPGNPKPRVFRLRREEAIINRMGFPNPGAGAAARRLAALPAKRGYMVGVSLGKQKETPLESASADYCAVMELVYPYADYLAVNVSSPNTVGLRELQHGRHLEELLTSLAAEGRRLAARHRIRARPLALKIAPDISLLELDQILEAAVRAGVAAIIATNTTLGRQGIAGPLGAETGGLSGRPLGPVTPQLIAHLGRLAQGKLDIIAAGGVFSADDVRARLDLGACLVQVYTGLVYEGPGLAGRILRDLATVDAPERRLQEA
jgi:dihydroorotate dehydrogenase